MFEEFLRGFLFEKPSNICVIGDSMLDQYYDVSVKKISPEFPIPVMASHEDSPKELPGGAANVAYQFRNFNVNVDLCSFLDWLAAEIFYRCGLNTKFSQIIEQKIPRKKRFYSDGFPTYRWDVEKPFYGLEENLKDFQALLCNNILEKIGSYDVVIFSDYDKGVFSAETSELIKKSKISIVDPKSKDIDKWKNCTIFKPNKKEALDLTGCDNIDDAGWSLLQRLDCEAVVITEADQGVSIFQKSGFFLKIDPRRSIEKAKSVIGAGDCFMAFLAMALTKGMTINKAVEIAWNAGQLYVQNTLNKPLSIEDLQKFDGSVELKILDNVDVLLDRDFSLVFTNGCFDLLHSGHLSLLNYAKKQGEKLVVAVNSDNSVSRLKIGRPFVGINERMSLLANLSCVDYVISFDEDTPLKLIEKLRPEVLVKGSEYNPKDIVGSSYAKKVVVAPMVLGFSTTSLAKKISEGKK
jgi:D-beta-D-heptose 7-phosphate kinase/D-beta-D-heptose 1-phosphate adenosyltransferase